MDPQPELPHHAGPGETSLLTNASISLGGLLCGNSVTLETLGL